MIKTKNKGTTSFWIKIIAGYLLGSVVLYSAASAANDNILLDHVVAVVNDDVIFSSQLEERLQSAFKKFRANKEGPLPSLDVLRQQILERLIIESLQLQLAERAGLTISNEELQNALTSIARQNNTDLDGLRASIEHEGLTYKTFAKSVEQEMIMQRIQQVAVNKRIDITNQDINNFLNSEEGKQRTASIYHLAHISISIPENATAEENKTAEELAEKIVVLAKGKSDDEFTALARQYSNAVDAKNGGDLGLRKKADLPSLYVDKVDQMAVGEVSSPFLSGDAIHILKLLSKQGAGDKWVQQTHARHILVKPSVIRSEEEANQLLLELKEQILSGKDFAEVAKKYSEDYGSALKGGDLGWTVPGQLVPQFQQVMDNTAVNKISEPFKSQFGWHIVQVLERRDQNMNEEMLNQAARNFLMQRRFEEELPRWLKELREEAYIDIKSEDAQVTAIEAAPEKNDNKDAAAPAALTPAP